MATPKIRAARRRNRDDDDLEELLSALSVGELWTALCAVRGEPTPRPRTLEDAREALRACGKSINLVRRALYTAEAAEPKPHCFFANFTPETKSTLPELERKQGNDVEGVRLAHVELGATRVRLTLEHTVRIQEWVTESATRRELRSRDLRIAVIIYVDPSTRRLVITYEGYATGTKDDYSRLVQTTLHCLTSLGLRSDAIPARMCIDALVQAGSTTVMLVRTSGQGPDGRFSISTQGLKPVEDAIARLSGAAPTANARLQIQEALRGASLDTVVLWWLHEQVSSRVQFWEHGADFFFLWGQSEAKSFPTLERIMSLLFGVAETTGKHTTAQVWSALVALSPGQVVLPTEFQSRFSVPAPQIKSVLAQSLAAGLVEPVYRLNTSTQYLEEFGREIWTADLMSLRRLFQAEDGTTLDGADPRNIAVAFRRTAGVQQT